MKLLRQIRVLFRKKTLDAVMAEKMRLHLELQMQENTAWGISPDEARYGAQPGFADELTGNLHSDQGLEIMELSKWLNREGTTVVQATHSDANATYGNRIVRLRDGWLAKD